MIFSPLKFTLIFCLTGVAILFDGASNNLNKFSINQSGQLIVSIVIKSFFAIIDNKSLHGNELVNSHCKNSCARTVTKRCNMCSNVDALREPGCKYLYASSTLAAAPFSTLRNALRNRYGYVILPDLRKQFLTNISIPTIFLQV